MGSGTWVSKAFANYTSTTKGMSMDDFSNARGLSAQSIYKSRHLSDVLNPKNVMRECCDSEEHPHTLPVILALDVTGSMGGSAVKVAQKLNQIMTDLYADDTIQDIEFCVMGIGDLAYDEAPIQMSQFESDIRIAEQLDAIYFERGGGGNSYESYSAAWYMGVNHCKLDCWNRGEKGIIITLGDELPNPHLPVNGYMEGLAAVTGDKLQGDVETTELLKEAQNKFDIYHISVDDPDSSYEYNQRRYDLDYNWKKLLGEDHYFVSGLDGLPKTIVNIIQNRGNTPVITSGTKMNVTENNEVCW